jgi:hypothetical protein
VSNSTQHPMRWCSKGIVTYLAGAMPRHHVRRSRNIFSSPWSLAFDCCVIVGWLLVDAGVLYAGRWSSERDRSQKREPPTRHPHGPRGETTATMIATRFVRNPMSLINTKHRPTLSFDWWSMEEGKDTLHHDLGIRHRAEGKQEWKEGGSTKV